MKFAKVFDLEDGNQVLVVRDGENQRLTVSTIINNVFRTMAPVLDHTKMSIDILFDGFDITMAAEIRKEMLEVDFDAKPDGLLREDTDQPEKTQE
jgi:hypothetical protein